MSVFQVVAILFALFMLYVVNIHRRKVQLSAAEVSFWYSMWFVFIVIAIFPEFLLGIANTLSFARVFDMLTVIALMILSVIVIFNYFIQRENARKLELLVRELAMSRTKERRKQTRKS